MGHGSAVFGVPAPPILTRNSLGTCTSEECGTAPVRLGSSEESSLRAGSPTCPARRASPPASSARQEHGLSPYLWSCSSEKHRTRTPYSSLNRPRLFLYVYNSDHCAPSLFLFSQIVYGDRDTTVHCSIQITEQCFLLTLQQSYGSYNPLTLKNQ